MTKIAIHSDHIIQDGEQFTFRASSNAADVTGLRIYYPLEDSTQETSQDFVFKDARGNTLTSLAIFALGAYVTVSIDTTNSHAYFLNYAAGGEGALTDLSNVVLDKSLYIDGAFRAATLPSSGYWYSAVYGGDKFVAISYADGSSGYPPTVKGKKVVYSTDGKNWTAASLPSNHNWTGLAYGSPAGLFVTLAEDAAVSAISKDGINWTEVAMPASPGWRKVVYGGNKFVAIAGSGSRTNVIAYAIKTDDTNTLTWTEGTITGTQYWSDIAYGNGMFVAIAQEAHNVSANPSAAWSTDGINWTSVSLPNSPHAGYWKSVAYGNGRFVAVKYSDLAASTRATNEAAYSTDGKNWVAATMPSAECWTQVIFAEGKFYAVADTNNALACSTDGINWTAINVTGASGNWRSLCAGKDRLVMLNAETDYSLANGNVAAYADFAYESPFFRQFKGAVSSNPWLWQRALGIAE